MSFTVLAVAWRKPRYDAATSGRPAPAWLDRFASSTALAVTLRVLGMVAFLYVGAAAVFGKDTLINPFLGTFYVLLWVGLVPASLLFGPVFKAISPARTISMLFAKVSGDPRGPGPVRLPRALGYWPAAAGLFAFVWLELVYPHSTDLGPARLWCAAYLGDHAGRLGALGHHLPRARRPVRGLLLARRQAVDLGPAATASCCIRSPLANLDTVVPRAGPGGRRRRALRQHRLRLLPGVERPG